MRELNVFPLISETNQGYPLLLLLLNIILEVLASALRKGDEKNTDRKKKKVFAADISMHKIPRILSKETTRNK